MIPRSPKVELTMIGIIFGFMLLQGVQGELVGKECGPGETLVPGESIKFECVPEDEAFTDNLSFQISMLVLNHIVLFAMGYRVRTLVNRTGSDQDDDFISDLFNSETSEEGNP